MIDSFIADNMFIKIIIGSGWTWFWNSNCSYSFM